MLEPATAGEFKDTMVQHRSRQASRKCFANVADASVFDLFCNPFHPQLSASSTIPQIHFYERLFGYMLFLFQIGVKTDMSVVHRTKKSAINIGSAIVTVPYLCGMAVVYHYSSKYLDKTQTATLGLVTGLYSMTTFPSISSVLSDLKILNSELGRLGLASALVTEIFNIFLSATFSITEVVYKTGTMAAFLCSGAFVLFVFLVIFVIRPAMFWIIKQTPEGSPVNDHYVYLVLSLALLASYASYRFGFHAFFGPFFLGLAIPEGPPLGTAVIKKIDTFVNGVLVPLFVTTCVMRVDLKDIMNWRNKVDGKVDNFMVQTWIIIVVTSVGKFVACLLLPLYDRMPLNDAVSLSLVMNCKGVVDIAVFTLLSDITFLPGNAYALLMISIILNATFVPMLVRYLYDPRKKYAGYTKRNIADLRTNSELRVLTCIHRPYNIPPTINLLEAAYPTKEEPLAAYVLHLKELIGRTTPVFIWHQLQKKKNTESKCSVADENLLDAFENFEKEFKGALVVNTFTAISPPEMMYDDICTMALDKFASLIVLPFHRKWSSDGNSVELEDENLRELNYRVLERAPCSVGILIERAQITHVFSPETPHTVCLLFIGGKDDIEALFFAKRMTKNPHVRLTVVRFLASKGSNTNVKDWQDILETELLDDIKMNKKVGDAYVEYIEKTVKDGPETALVIRSLVTEFDLIIVGRLAGIETPQTSGLLQWSEYPELGVLGDLLASTDAAGKASVFVMRQQITAMDIKK
ncbi:cation/H(+) antiporter 3-like [Gastrolobium bilobum]|uniref:cation/H(+) antiporter 3-like n=1 Tax=Gastrolobium bilobum TaxID=150636 RepID=UPI002AAF3FFC|nr:cation/H(+) antiporter 3-like [Gastrolobium bilobum]